jgi:hypothetical protein
LGVLAVVDTGVEITTPLVNNLSAARRILIMKPLARQVEDGPVITLPPWA